MTTALGSQALRYREIVTAAAACAPNSGEANWDELASLVATGDFVQVGRDKRELDWPDAVAAMDRWARETAFASKVRRLEQAGPLVFMELEEQSTVSGRTTTLETMTVFEFDPAGKLRRLDLFR